MVGAKAQPSSLLLPIIQKRQNVSVRTGAWVRRILLDPAPKSAARGVSYVDAAGQEVFQPASLVFLASWTFNNTRLLLLSGIGEPYHPATRSEEHTSELQSRGHLVCRLLLEKKKHNNNKQKCNLTRYGHST